MDRVRTFLQTDGLVSFQCSDGFIYSSGVEGERICLKSPTINETGDGALPFFNFLRAVFRIVPTRASTSHTNTKNENNNNNNNNKANSEHSHIKNSSNETQQGNTSSMNDPTDGIGEGTNITYGMVFSLQHMSSQLYLSVAHSQPSENDPDCVSVVLVPASAAATPSCEFTFVSRYKVRGDGDNVCKEDEVLLRLASRPVYLHVSAPRQLDEASTELEEGDVQVINRTFRLGANMSFLNGNMMSNATTLANNNSIGLHNTDSATANLSFFGAAELTAGLEETMKGYEKQMANILPKRDSGPFTALHALTREYLDEVNGCEEGGVTFTVHRYDIGKDRCELQRSQLHISKQHVACGVPLSLFHQERESFLTTSVTNPREVTATVAVKVDDGAVEEDCSGVFKQRSAAAHLSQVTTSSGAEGQLCQKAPAAAAAGGGGLESGTNTPQTLAETVKGFSAAPSMTSASRETGAQARYTAKMKDIGGLVDTGKGEFLPFPVFAEHPKSAAELKQDAMLGDVGTHINSLWSFECEDPTCGGPVRLESESYRVKHVMTGLYLAVCGSAVDDFILEEEELESDGHPATAPGSSSSSSSQEEGDNTNNTGSSGSSSLDSSVSEAIPLSCRAPKNNDIRETCLCLIPEPRTAHDMRRTLFTVETMFQTEMLWLVEQECFTLRNVLTQMYVCTDSAVEGSNVRLSLQWQPVLADTLVVTGVLPATQRCALLLRDQCFALGRYKDLMQETAKMVLAERQQVADAAEAGEETAKLTMRRWREETEEAKAAGERSRRGPDIDFELYRAKRRYHEAPHTAQPPPPVHGDYRHLTHAIHAAQRALETLIRLCIETREFNIFTAEGIPNAAHQRMLFEIQLHKLLFDVVLAPLALLQTDLHAFGPVVKSTVAPQLGDHLSRGGGRLIDMLVDKQTRPVTSLWEVNRDWCRTTIPSVPLQGGLLTPDQLLQPLHRELHLLTRLAFRLLRCMAMRNSALTQGWTEYLDICLFLDGNRLHVVDALKEMFTDNLQLDLSSVQKVGEHFINISKSVRKGSYINFLGAACTYRFQGIAQRQAFVCKRFLMEHPEMFCTFKVEHGVLHVHPAGHNKNRWYPVLEFFEKNKDPREVKYVEYQISLLARLCYEGCPPFTRNEVKKIFTEEIALVALRTICWTGKEHVGHRSGTDILRSHFLRLAMQVHVLPRASDPWVQLRVTTVLFGSSGLRQKHCDNYSGLQDDEITRAVKHVCLCLLRANTFFIQDDVDRSTLMRSVVSVLLRLIRYRQYKLSEIEEVIPLFLLLLDGTRDIVDSRRLKSQIEATQSAQTPFQPSATNNNYRHTDTSHLPNRLSINLASIHLIRVREMVCLALIAALENATFTAAEEVILYLYECYTDGRPTAYPWRGEGGSEKGGGFSAAMESTCCGGCKKKKKGVVRSDGYEELVDSDDDPLQDYSGSFNSSLSSVPANDTFADNAILTAFDSLTGYTVSPKVTESGTFGFSLDQLSGSTAVFTSNDNSNNPFHSNDTHASKPPQRRRKAEEEGKPLSVSVTSRELNRYLDFLTNRVCKVLCPEKLVPLLLDITRYKNSQLTVQAMRLLVQMCIVKKNMAQLVLQVNTIPSLEVVKRFDEVHDVAVKLQQCRRDHQSYSPKWDEVIRLTVSALLDVFEEEKTSSPGSTRDLFTSFALGKKEQKVFDEAVAYEVAAYDGFDSTESDDEEPGEETMEGGDALEEASGDRDAAGMKSRVGKLWAKAAGATRMIIYGNTIRNRRRALGLNETSKIPINLVVRAEMMAHWRVHDSLLDMLPDVPVEEGCFFRLIKFFYFFTMSTANCKLLQPHVEVFINVLHRCEKTRALSLNIIVAVLSTFPNVDHFLTYDLLSMFAWRIDHEVYTKMPDREFVELLSHKVFNRTSSVGVVVRRRFMLILRQHNTLRSLTKPRSNPSTLEVLFNTSLMNLVCNVCGSAVSVLTLAQGMLPADLVCRMIIDVGKHHPLFYQYQKTLKKSGLTASQQREIMEVDVAHVGHVDTRAIDALEKEVEYDDDDDDVMSRSSLSLSLSSRMNLSPGSPTSPEKAPETNRNLSKSFKLINPFLRALIALYFTTSDDNPEEQRSHRGRWTADVYWWVIMRLFSTHLRTVNRQIDRDHKQKRIVNRGFEVVFHYRTYFLKSIPIAVTAFFVNCFNGEVYFTNQDMIGDALLLLLKESIHFCRFLLLFNNALLLTVEEVVNYRRMLSTIRKVVLTLDAEEFDDVLTELTSIKDEMRQWLLEKQGLFQDDLLKDQLNTRRMGLSEGNEYDTGAFDVLFRESTVSDKLQSAPSAMLITDANEDTRTMQLMQTALRGILKGNTLISSISNRPSDVALIVNACLLSSLRFHTSQETVSCIIDAMHQQLFSSRTFVGLLNLFYNALDTVLHHPEVHKQSQLISDKSVSFYSNWLSTMSSTIGKGSDNNNNNENNSNNNDNSEFAYLNDRIDVNGDGYRLQTVFNSLGMMQTVLAICSIANDVITFNALRLGVVLLDGGNKEVQDSLLRYYTTREENFFQSVRDVLRNSTEWVSHINAEHQYYLLKRGIKLQEKYGQGGEMAASTNMQLIEALIPRREHHLTNKTRGTVVELSGWSRVYGSRRLKLIQLIFRLLQLFCEGHHSGLQNYIRNQHDNLHSINMLHESMTFLNSISQFVTQANLRVISQGFILLTEVCQGPCAANQEALIGYDVCVMVRRILGFSHATPQHGSTSHTEVDRLNQVPEEELSKLRQDISTTMLALIEGCRKRPVYERLMAQLPLTVVENEIAAIRPSLFYRVTHDETLENNHIVEAVFNWLIYICSVRPYTNELELKQIDEIMRRCAPLTRYLGSIEVSRGDERTLEVVYFRIPQICFSLTKEHRTNLVWEVDRNSRATKLADFLHKSDEIIFAVETLHDFSHKVHRRTRFTLSEGGEGLLVDNNNNNESSSHRHSCCGGIVRGVKSFFNRYIAGTLFSVNTSYYESISMAIALIVNTILVAAEGSPLLKRPRIYQEEQILLRSLCLIQVLVCAAILYMEIVVALPIQLYILYKKKQRYSGTARIGISMKEVYEGLTARECFDCIRNWFTIQFRVCLLIFAILSVVVSPLFAAFNLMLFIYKISTLRTFITAITMNGKQLMLTFLLGLIMVYLFSIVGFLLFPGSFDATVDESENPNLNHCATLLQCFTYIMSQGLRAGGGVGDVMQPWDFQDSNLLSRVTYEMTFYALVTVVFLNIMFGIIIDTFGQMRDEKREKEIDMHTVCFICGLDADVLEKVSSNGFVSHVRQEHNMWMYLFFMHHLRRKDPNEYTGQESYVQAQIQKNNLSFFPDEDCLSLHARRVEEKEGDSSDSDSDHEKDDTVDLTDFRRGGVKRKKGNNIDNNNNNLMNNNNNLLYRNQMMTAALQGKGAQQQQTKLFTELQNTKEALTNAVAELTKKTQNMLLALQRIGVQTSSNNNNNNNNNNANKGSQHESSSRGGTLAFGSTPSQIIQPSRSNHNNNNNNNNGSNFGKSPVHNVPHSNNNNNNKKKKIKKSAEETQTEEYET